VHDRVDGIERRLVEPHIGTGEHVVELLHGARPDDGRCDRRVLEHEGVREVREARAGARGELEKLLHDLESVLVGPLRSLALVLRAESTREP
jgi:hypothetical protein